MANMVSVLGKGSIFVRRERKKTLFSASFLQADSEPSPQINKVQNSRKSRIVFVDRSILSPTTWRRVGKRKAEHKELMNVLGQQSFMSRDKEQL
jgi:hypothetical protein